MGWKVPADIEAKCEALHRPRGNPRQTLAPDARWAEAAKPDPVRLTVAISIATPNPLNGRRHWHTAARLAREQVRATLAALNYLRLSGRVDADGMARLATGCTVLLRRVCPSPGLADDALHGALKHVRDAVAQWILGGRIGERDSDRRLVWGYEQSRLGKASGVIVTLTRE